MGSITVAAWVLARNVARRATNERRDKHRFSASIWNGFRRVGRSLIGERPDPTPIANHVRRLAGCQPPQRFLALVWGLFAGIGSAALPLSLGFADIPRMGRVQKHACHVAAGWALVPDQSRLTCERRNPDHLVHNGFASRACKAGALRNICHAAHDPLR